MTRSWNLSFNGVSHPDTLQDHHNREGELLFPIYVSQHCDAETVNILIHEELGMVDDALPDWVRPTEEETQKLAKELVDNAVAGAFLEDGEIPHWVLLTWEETED